MEIKGIYKLPKIKHVFFIVPSLDEFSDSPKPCRESKRRMEYFGRILRSKDHKTPKATPHWTLKLVTVSDLETILKQHNPIGQVSSSQTCDNPEYLELLAINLVKTPNSLDCSQDSQKVLSCVSDEDIIEVFI